MFNMGQFNCQNHWHEQEIQLTRPVNGNQSLGITIDGGTDKPFVYHRFTSIIITGISENGLADRDQRLRIYDIILRVNDVDLKNVKYQNALDELEKPGEKVRLLIRRLSPPINDEIELEHNGKLGIRIAGGFGNEYVQNDHGIFIAAINGPQTNNQLDIGDRLLKISSKFYTYDLRFVTHEIAKKSIKFACEESQTIKLHVGRIRPIIRVQTRRHQGQYDSDGMSREEGTVPVNETQYLIVTRRNQHAKTEDPNINRHITDGMPNERRLNNDMTEPLRVSFCSNGCQSYANHSRFNNNLLQNDRGRNRSSLLPVVERDEPVSRVIKFVKIGENGYTYGVLFVQQQHSFTIAPRVQASTTDQNVNDSDRNHLIPHHNLPQFRREETAIDDSSPATILRYTCRMTPTYSGSEDAAIRRNRRPRFGN